MTQIGLRFADGPNAFAPASPDGRGDTIDVSRLLSAIRRRRRSILLPVGLALMLGFSYLLTTPKTYVASSTLLLDAGANDVVRELTAIGTSALSDVAIENARLVIRSDVLADAVARRLDLVNNAGFINPPQSLASRLSRGAVDLLRLPITLARLAIQPNPSPAPTQEDAAAQLHRQILRELGGRIRVERVSRSGGVSVIYSSTDAALAAEIVNAYTEAYIADVQTSNFEATERTTEWLKVRLSDLEAAAAEAAVQAEVFRAEHGIVSADGRTMTEASVNALNAELDTAIAEAARSRALVEGYEAAVSRGIDGLRSGIQVGAEPSVDPGLEDLQSRLAAAIADLNRITLSFGADHPQARRVSDEVDVAAERLYVDLQQRLERARGALLVSQSRVEALRESVDMAMGNNVTVGAAEVQLRALERRAETLSTLYQTFLTQFQQVDRQKDFPISDVRILSRAEVPRDAEGPRASRVMPLALVIGLFLGLAVAVILEWRDRFLRSGEDVFSAIGAPFLGFLPDLSSVPAKVPVSGKVVSAIGRLVGKRWDAYSGEIAAGSLNQAVYLDTLQSIRLAMDTAQFGGREPVFSLRRTRETVAPSSRRVLGITSICPGEGKSSLSLNLANTLTASGHAVLLIDTDLRQSSLSRSLGFFAGPSIVDVALGNVPWTEALRKLEQPGLDLLPCVVPDSRIHGAELFAAKRGQDVFRDAPERYAYVIVDLAPLGPMVDARVLLRLLDQVLLVTQWGTTPRTAFRYAVQREPALAERLIGTVLNRADMVALRDYPDSMGTANYAHSFNRYPC